MLFFYEVFEQQFDAGDWTPFAPDASFGTSVQLPTNERLEGFDVVTFSSQTSPEHAPLSCNGLGARVPTNSHCLIESFEEARRLLETGTFDDSERGPHRIFAAYSVPWPRAAAST
jgi:hypothetical protein